MKKLLKKRLRSAVLYKIDKCQDKSKKPEAPVLETLNSVTHLM